MYCKRCGKYNPEYTKVCLYCGSNELVNDVRHTNNPNINSQEYGRDKTSIGIILSLFLGIIGLIIGLLLYPAGTYERESFLNAWTKTFVVCLIVSVSLTVFTVGCSTCAAMGYL